MTEELYLAWWYFCRGFMVSQLANIPTTLFLHRSSTHRSITYHPAIEFIFVLDLWLTTGLVGAARKFWVAVHLKHHAHSDQAGDPHSPNPGFVNFLKVQFGGLFLYLMAKRDPKILDYAKNVKLTWFEKIILKIKFGTALGPVLGTGIACLIWGLRDGVIISAVHAFLYLFVLNNLVNGWCHVRGYKNFPSAVAGNNRFVAIITAGEGLHNNHHEMPGSPILSVRKSEIDIGGLIAKFLVFLRLARFERAVLTAGLK